MAQLWFLVEMLDKSNKTWINAIQKRASNYQTPEKFTFKFKTCMMVSNTRRLENAKRKKKKEMISLPKFQMKSFRHAVDSIRIDSSRIIFEMFTMKVKITNVYEFGEFIYDSNASKIQIRYECLQIGTFHFHFRRN